MNRSLIALAFLLSATSVAFGQSDADFRARFSRISAYEVRPGIIMIATFGPNGEASELVFQKEHTTPGIVDLDSTLSQRDIIDIVEKIIPEVERGKRLKGFLGRDDGTTSIDGTTMETEYQYERISVVFYGGVATKCHGDMVAIVRWRDNTKDGPSAK